MLQLEEIVSSLRKDGLRITPQRVAIVDYVMKSKEHPSAEQIYNFVKKKYPMVSLSTVYKTLELLKEKRLVNELKLEGQNRFDANTGEHVNLVCLKCGKIDDIEEDSVKEVRLKAGRKSKYLVVRGNFELFGYSGSCKQTIKSTG